MMTCRPTITDPDATRYRAKNRFRCILLHRCGAPTRYDVPKGTILTHHAGHEGGGSVWFKFDDGPHAGCLGFCGSIWFHSAVATIPPPLTCPRCGNTDPAFFGLLEPVERRRQYKGRDRDGSPLVEAVYTTDDDNNKAPHWECMGPSPLGNGVCGEVWEVSPEDRKRVISV